MPSEKFNHKIALRIPGSTKITQQEVPLLFSFSSFLVFIQMSTENVSALLQADGRESRQVQPP